MSIWWQWLVKKNVAHRINDRLVLVEDHTKTPKDGRKMPAVATLHQDSETGSKPSYFRGHHWGCIGILMQACDKYFAVPLWANILKNNLYGFAKDWITQLIQQKQKSRNHNGSTKKVA